MKKALITIAILVGLYGCTKKTADKQVTPIVDAAHTTTFIIDTGIYLSCCGNIHVNEIQMYTQDTGSTVFNPIATNFRSIGGSKFRIDLPTPAFNTNFHHLPAYEYYYIGTTSGSVEIAAAYLCKIINGDTVINYR